jgi:hypothetical protein
VVWVHAYFVEANSLKKKKEREREKREQIKYLLEEIMKTMLTNPNP